MKKLLIFAVFLLLLLSLLSCSDSKTNLQTETETSPPPEPESPCTVTSFSVLAEKNPGVYEDIIATVGDNTITLNAGLLCDTNALKIALTDIVTDGVYYTIGDTEYSLMNEEGKTADLTGDTRLTLTDSDGLCRVYDIVINYTENRLPVIHINTSDGADITTKEKYADAVITIDAEGVDGWYLPEGFDSLDETYIGIKGRGNSTWKWDKKPYKIKFDDKTEVLGMTEAKKWVLLANYADFSLIRNYVAFEGTRVLSNELSPLHQYPVNLFLNGKYIGVYTLGEDKDVAEGRIDLPDDTGEADTSFLLELFGSEDGDVLGEDYFNAGDMKWCKIQYPEKEDLTSEQFDFIYNYCQKTDSDVYFNDGWEDSIDLDSFVNWFISSELFYNTDSCFRRSCYLMKEPGGKLKMGPIWDFDLAIGNLHHDYGLYDTWLCNTQEKEIVPKNWFTVLLENETFRTRLREVWDEKKDALLENILYSIDTMGATVAPSAKYNFEVWDILGTTVNQPKEMEEIKTYEGHIEYVRNFIINRWNWLDANI